MVILASAVMVAYFILLILISFIITYLTSSKRRVRKQKRHISVPVLKADKKHAVNSTIRICINLESRSP